MKDIIEKKLDSIYPLLAKDDLLKYAKLFKHELIAALHNQVSSLPTILNPINKIVPSPGFGVAVSVGGTNGYVSAFQISKKGVIRFLNRKFFVLPVDTTREKLFKTLAENIFAAVPKKKKVFPIGIGFAYALKPLLVNKFIDGRLLYTSKGRIISGLVGKNIGQEFHKFLILEYGIDTTVAVANDAICLLLGASNIEIAGVVGTGFNFAYFEKREAIAPLKLSDLPGFGQREVAVNIESANFDKIKGTKLRSIVDQLRQDKFSLAEKEVAGAYLYQIFNAGKKELLGQSFPDLSSTDQLNDMLTGAYKFPKEITVESQKNAKRFADRIFHRSAQIVAVELCGISMKIGKTIGIVPIVMEGGIFWKALNYPSLVNLYVNMILPQVTPSFARLFGSSRRGIAILARNST